MKIIAGLVLSGAVCAAIYVNSPHQRAHASDDVDCSKLSKWNSGATYHKGDIAWFKPETENRGWEYKCASKTCHANKPAHSSEWTVVAECKFGSDPK
jgi:hypothetical protein